MLSVVIIIFFSGFASATYYLNQPPPPPPSVPNKIDRPVGYGVGYGGGVYPATNPFLQNLYAQTAGGFPPVVQRVPLPFAIPRPVSGRPAGLSAPSPGVSELLSLLNSQAQLNNLGHTQDVYEGYEEKVQADPEKIAGLPNNMRFYPAEKLRTGPPGFIYRSSLRNNEENVTSVKDEPGVIGYSTGGNGIIYGLTPAVYPALTQAVGNTLPTSSGVPFITTVKVIPQGTPGMGQTQTKQTAAEISNELNNAVEGYTLQLSGAEEKAPEYQLVTTGAIDALTEGGEDLSGGVVQSGAVPSNTAAVLGLRKIPIQPYGDLFLIPSGGRFSKSIDHSKSEDVVRQESEDAKR